jgi:hypothetical protein
MCGAQCAVRSAIWAQVPEKGGVWRKTQLRTRIEVQPCLVGTDLLHGTLTALDVKSWTEENVAGHKHARETNDVAQHSGFASREPRTNVEHKPAANYDEDNNSKDKVPVEINDADSDIEGEDTLGLQPIGSRDWSAIKKVMSKAEKRKWCVEQLESEQLRGSATDLVNVVQPFIDVLREVDSGQIFMGKIYHRLFTIQ